MPHERMRRACAAFAFVAIASVVGAPAGAGTSSRATVSAGATARTISATLDGVALAQGALDRGGLPPLIALGPLATKLGWTLVRLQSGARMEGEDRTVTLVTGSRAFRENGDLHAFFHEAPVERDGYVFLAANDAARFFGLTFTRTARGIAFVRPAQLQSDLRVVELAAPPAPGPRATPRRARQSNEAQLAAAGSAGRVTISLDRSAGTNVFGIRGETQSAFLRTNLSSSGVDRFGVPSGTVSIGTLDRHVALGQLLDPLDGLIFRGTIDTGIDFSRADQRRSVVMARRISDGRSIVAIAESLPGGGSDSVAVLSRDGNYDQTIVRRFRLRRLPWGDFSRELMIGDHGVGVGIAARTRGRTFVESNLSFATRGLRLGPDDAPISIDAGRELSSATTVVGGFATGPQLPLGPFAGISTRTGRVVGAISATSRAITANLSYQTSDASIQFYAIPGAQRASGAQATFLLDGATVDAQLTNTAGSRDASIEMRTLHRGLNLVAGLGLPAGGRVGPIAGLSVPLTPLLAFEVTTRPAGAGKSAIRVALALGIAARRPRGPSTFSSRVRVDTRDRVTPMRLFVDGVPVRTFSTATTTIELTRGQHVVAIETLDGTAASPDVPLRVDAAGDGVSLPLWAQRTITGRVVAGASTAVPAGFSLAGIVVVVQPGNVVTETAADGTFVFPYQPFAPDATIGVDASSLPRMLSAPDRAPLQAGSIDLTLRPGMLLEQTHFSSR